jgi:NADH:ubiquinone oxidoreductase subunit 4 (subunit M)
VAQNDIKRILAYSTISQLGYMMAGLGMGGVAVGMFHLITHAFFKALLVHGRGLGDSRLPRGAGHSPHGRAAGPTCR